MAGKSSKGSGHDEPGVLGNLPSTRPSRMSRRARPDARAARAATVAPAPAPAPAKKARPTAARATKPAKPVTAKPATVTPAAPRKPRAVRQASPALEVPAARAHEKREDAVERPAQSGTQLAGTVVQAAGELASIGLTIGGQILKRVSGRLPRP